MTIFGLIWGMLPLLIYPVYVAGLVAAGRERRRNRMVSPCPGCAQRDQVPLPLVCPSCNRNHFADCPLDGPERHGERLGVQGIGAGVAKPPAALWRRPRGDGFQGKHEGLPPGLRYAAWALAADINDGETSTA